MVIATPDPACIGDTITFTASGVVDSGGIRRFNCSAFAVSPVAPAYAWVITKPDGTTTSGSGQVGTVAADQPGPYSALYQVTATRFCAPTAIFISGTAEAITLEIITPNGDPTTSTGANATNERAYGTAAADPTVTVPCVVATAPDPNMLRWTIQDVGSVKATWSPSVSGDPNTGIGLTPTATFTGLPSSFDDFGLKTITVNVEGSPGCQDTQDVELFYPGTATNHPGSDMAAQGSGRSPNWFFYWNQSGAGDGNAIHSSLIGNSFGQTPAMLLWSNPLTYSKSVIWIGDHSTGSDTRRDGSGQTVTGIDLFANVVLHELRHTEQISENDGALGVLNGQT